MMRPEHLGDDEPYLAPSDFGCSTTVSLRFVITDVSQKRIFAAHWPIR